MNELVEAKIEVARELMVRRHVYPKLVAQGKLTSGEAARRVEALRHVLFLLDQVPRPQPVERLHTTD